MVPFAGYKMPIQYPTGGKKEHFGTRESVGLFDVSHMGQYRFKGSKAADFLERMTVVDTQSLAPKQGSLSMLMTRAGTIKDDCIITKISDQEFNVVLNAGCKDTDIEHMNNVMGEEFSG